MKHTRIRIHACLERNARHVDRQLDYFLTNPRYLYTRKSKERVILIAVYRRSSLSRLVWFHYRFVIVGEQFKCGMKHPLSDMYT